MKHIFFVASFVTLSFVAKAQNNINPFFHKNYSVYNDISLSSPSCVTFSEANITGWFRTHGAALFYDEWGCVFHEYDDPHPLMMDFNNFTNKGDGIATYYHFIVGQTYEIRVGICFSTFGDYDDNAKLNIKATQESPLTTTPGCTDPIPTPSGTIETVYTGSPNDGAQLVITFTPSENLEYLWLYPDAPAGANPGNNNYIGLGYVCIRRLCEEQIDITSTNVIPLTYNYYKYINVGPHNTVNIDPTNITQFIASKSVTINETFLATTTSGNYFLAAIDKLQCTWYCGYGTKTNEQPDNGINRNHLHTNNKLLQNGQMSDLGRMDKIQLKMSNTIFPNPAYDRTTVQLDKNIKSITIRDVNGRIVYSQKYSDNNYKTEEIIILNEIPKGCYIVEIISDEVKRYEKLIKL